MEIRFRVGREERREERQSTERERVVGSDVSAWRRRREERGWSGGRE